MKTIGVLIALCAASASAQELSQEHLDAAARVQEAVNEVNRARQQLMDALDVLANAQLDATDAGLEVAIFPGGNCMQFNFIHAMSSPTDDNFNPVTERRASYWVSSTDTRKIDLFQCEPTIRWLRLVLDLSGVP